MTPSATAQERHLQSQCTVKGVLMHIRSYVVTKFFDYLSLRIPNTVVGVRHTMSTARQCRVLFDCAVQPNIHGALRR